MIPTYSSNSFSLLILIDLALSIITFKPNSLFSTNNLFTIKSSLKLVNDLDGHLHHPSVHTGVSLVNTLQSVLISVIGLQFDNSDRSPFFGNRITHACCQDLGNTPDLIVSLYT
jgi:hypothetical protein